MPPAAHNTLHDPRAFPQHFPQGTAFWPIPGQPHTHGYWKGGNPISASPDWIAASMLSLTDRYVHTLTRLASVPGLDTQIAYMVLSLCTRPCTRFGHLFRYAPPTTTALLAHRTWEATLHTLATVLRINPHELAQDHPRRIRHALTLPLSSGGMGILDPHLAARPSFIASWADTLQPLMARPEFADILSSPHLWPDSPSPQLRALHTEWHALISDAHVRTPPARHAEAHHTMMNKLADPAHPADSLTAPPLLLSRLHRIGQRHAQGPLTDCALTSYTHNLLTALHSTDRAAVVMAAQRGAAIPLLTTLISRQTRVTDPQFCTYVAHRARFTLPLVQPTTRCLPQCRYFGPARALPPDSPHLLGWRQGYHFFACLAGGFATQRHNTLVRLWANMLRTCLHMKCHTRDFLETNHHSRQQIDAIAYDLAARADAIAYDASFICGFNASYVVRAARCAADLTLIRETSKNAAHRADCEAASRLFVPLVFTSLLGAGDHMWAHIDHLWALTHHEDMRTGGSGLAAAVLKQHALIDLWCGVMRQSSAGVLSLLRGERARADAPAAATAAPAADDPAPDIALPPPPADRAA